VKTVNRINKYLELKGITPKAFEDAIGISNGNFGKQLSRGTPINSDILAKIAEVYPELNLVWLITGKGYMTTNPPKTSKEDELVNQILNDEQVKYNSISKASKLIKEALDELKSVSPAKRRSARK
jgi:hypothetical protein